MNLEFTQQELNYVLQVLSQRPFAEVAQLINKIQNQLNPDFAEEQKPSKKIDKK